MSLTVVFAGLTESIVGVLVLIAAGLGALAAIGHYVRNGVSTVLRFFHRLDKALENVEKQLYPNGGASLRDAVNRIQERLGIENVAVDAHADDPPVL